MADLQGEREEAANTDSFVRILGIENAKPTRKLVVLGASGSVGSTALRYLERENGIELSGVSVHTSVNKLEDIIRRFPSIRYAALSCPDASAENIGTLKSRYPGIRFFGGEGGVIEMIEESRQDGVDTVLTAVVGAAGIRATIKAIELSMKVALANKETLVTAGPAILSLLRKKIESGNDPAPIVPVDSEHNAVFQLIEKIRADHVRRIILTASGGPFFDLPLERLTSVTRTEVLSHPTWSMGPKITVDSAGMINKGLEMIEAHYLFSIPYDRLGVYIHRKSLVHAMVETRDGGYHLHASSPDMIFPVAHALQYPDPTQLVHEEALSPDLWDPISFHPVQMERYPGFGLCLEAGKTGGTAPAVFNGANEVAVDLFLNGRIGFTDIVRLIQLVMDEAEFVTGEDLEIYLDADRAAREATIKLAGRFS